MDTLSIEEREIAAFAAGFAAETLAIRGYALTAEETAEITTEAREIYGVASAAPATVAA